MNITSVGSGTPVTRLQGSKAANGNVLSQDASAPGEDTVEISDVARYLSEIKKLPDVREDKVAAAREGIANGTLDTPANLDSALNSFLDEHA